MPAVTCHTLDGITLAATLKGPVDVTEIENLTGRVPHVALVARRNRSMSLPRRATRDRSSSAMPHTHRMPGPTRCGKASRL